MHCFPPIDFKAELNDEQYAVVTAPEGPLLVLAGAGSGKTRTLTYRVAYLLHQGVQPHEILLLSFTNKATREMLARVETLTGIPSECLWGGTFHSIAQRILRVHGERVGLIRNYTILDQGEAESILKNVIQGMDPGFLQTKNYPKLRVIADRISYARNTCGCVKEEANEYFSYIEGMADRIQKFHQAYMQAKLEQQVADFDDLPEYLLKLLREHPEIRQQYQDRFKHILIDEFQDTNCLQSKLVEQFADRHQIMAVGDDAQCIYTWRGADFNNIMEFRERHPGAIIYKIETNYRSSPEILDFANRVLAAQPSRAGYSKELRPVKPSSEKPYFVPLMDARSQADFIINCCNSLIDAGRDPADIAILYRAHYQSMELQIELTRLNIEYQITSGVRFFEKAHIKDFTAQLRLVFNPKDLSAFMRLSCLLPKIGSKTAEKLHTCILELAENSEKNFFELLMSAKVLKKVPAAAKEQWANLAVTLSELSAALTEEAPFELIEMALKGWYSGYIREVYPDWADRADDLHSLIGFARNYETIEEFLAQLVLLASEIHQNHSGEASNCLRLTTIHQAKGLEFPIVFVIGLADGNFPLRRAIDEGDLEEERRLFYVAVTRAMETLYLTYPLVNHQGNQYSRLHPSRFIEEVNADCYETIRVKPVRREF